MIYTETLILTVYEDMLKECSYFRPDKNYISQLPNNQYNELPPYDKINNKYDLKFIWDMAYKVYLDKILSSKQYELLLNILPKYKSLYMDLGLNKDQYEYWLTHKGSKTIKVYESKQIKREVRYIGDNTFAFRFIYTPELAKFMKDINKKSMANLRLIREHDIWLLEINERNKTDLINLISGNGFDFDSSVEQYFLEYENTKDLPVTIDIIDEKCNISAPSHKLFATWLKRELSLEESYVK